MIPILSLGAASVDIPGDVAQLVGSIMITMVVIITWMYVGRKSRGRSMPMKNKYGPLFLVLLGGMLMLCEPIRYELHDAGMLHIPVHENV